MRDAGEDFSWGSRGGILAFQYLSYWYGGLYVVIEGWRTLGLQDERVDDLLDSPNVELLRRYRNGVFHFQRKYLDDRFLDLMGEGQSVVEWVRELNDAFGQYLLREVRLPRGSQGVEVLDPVPEDG